MNLNKFLKTKEGALAIMVTGIIIGAFIVSLSTTTPGYIMFKTGSGYEYGDIQIDTLVEQYPAPSFENHGLELGDQKYKARANIPIEGVCGNPEIDGTWIPIPVPLDQAEAIQIDIFKTGSSSPMTTYCANLYQESPTSGRGKADLKTKAQEVKTDFWVSAEMFHYESRGKDTVTGFVGLSKKVSEPFTPDVSTFSFTRFDYDGEDQELNLRVDYETNVYEDNLAYQVFLDGNKIEQRSVDIRKKTISMNIPRNSGEHTVKVLVRTDGTYDWEQLYTKYQKIDTSYQSSQDTDEDMDTEDVSVDVSGEITDFKASYDVNNEEINFETKVNDVEGNVDLKYYVDGSLVQTKTAKNGEFVETMSYPSNQGQVEVGVKLTSSEWTRERNTVVNTETKTCDESWQVYIDGEGCVEKNCGDGEELNKDTGYCETVDSQIDSDSSTGGGAISFTGNGDGEGDVPSAVPPEEDKILGMPLTTIGMLVIIISVVGGIALIGVNSLMNQNKRSRGGL